METTRQIDDKKKADRTTAVLQSYKLLRASFYFYN